jgi:hypothetical protein
LFFQFETRTLYEGVFGKMNQHYHDISVCTNPNAVMMRAIKPTLLWITLRNFRGTVRRKEPLKT